MLWKQVNVITYILFMEICSYGVQLESIIENKTINEGGCIMNGVNYNVGESWPGPLGECMLYKCIGLDGTYSGVTCGSVAVPPDSECVVIPGNYKHPYPICCDSVDCFPHS